MRIGMRAVSIGVAMAVVLGTIAGCRSLGVGGSCNEPGPYVGAASVPPLKIPAGLEAPDTRNALRVPELAEPEPPPRKVSDPCLDSPPKYTTAPRPQA